MCIRRVCGVDWKTWRRPTLPCLEAQYHGRWGFSRPSSGWDRVRAPRDDHQVIQSTRLLGAVAGVWPAAGPEEDRGMVVLVCVVCVAFLGMISMHDVGARAVRAIRTGQLRALPRLHIRPIDVMVSHGPYGVAPWEIWF